MGRRLPRCASHGLLSVFPSSVRSCACCPVRCAPSLTATAVPSSSPPSSTRSSSTKPSAAPHLHRLSPSPPHCPRFLTILRLCRCQFRTRLSHHLLGAEKKLPPQLNHLEPIVVSAGGDSFAQIGSAQGGDGEGGDGGSASSVALVEGWQKLYGTYFPVKASDAEVVVNLEELKLLPEPQIDQLVQAKESDTHTHNSHPTHSSLLVPAAPASVAVLLNPSTDVHVSVTVGCAAVLCSEELKKKKRDLDLQRKVQQADSSAKKR
jgi:hypothetical protein